MDKKPDLELWGGIECTINRIGNTCVDQLNYFQILTYMRIKDSLNESTSTFKAELNRLKMIFSRDKYLGSKVFIEKLIETKMPALFATHDLQTH